MGPSIVRRNLNSFRVRICSYIVSSGHNVKSRSILSTMRSSENKLVADESSSAEPSIINEESNNPRPLVLLCFISFIFNSTNIIKIPFLPDIRIWYIHLFDNILDKIFIQAQISLHSILCMSGLVFGKISSSRWPPVLFWEKISSKSNPSKHQNCSCSLHGCSQTPHVLCV